MHYLLIYDLASDYLERRAPLRSDHITLARAAETRGELVLGGALANPADEAILLFRGDSPAARRKGKRDESNRARLAA